MLSLNAQSLSPQVVAAAGTSFSTSTVQVDFTTAEVFTSAYNNGGFWLTQGFHQPEIIITSIIPNEDELALSFYPNPTEQYVTVESTLEKELQIRVFDALGKSEQVSSLFTKNLTLDLRSLISGSYVMVITNASGNPIISYTLLKLDR
jgi:hypothetical protein